MRRSVLVLALLAVLTLAGGKVVLAAANSLTIDPFDLSTGGFSAQYETAIGYDTSMCLTAEYWRLTEEGMSVGAGVGLRKYISGRALDGFCVGIYGDASCGVGPADPEGSDEENPSRAAPQSWATISLSPVTGFKLVTASGLTVDANVGVRFLLTTVMRGDTASSADEPPYEYEVQGSHNTVLKLGFGVSW